MAALALVLLTACSTKKNTAGTRFWHSFTARYNTYYNGNEAYKEGFLSKESSNRDNYTDFIPVFYVGNENSRGLGATSFLTTVTKCEKAIHLHSIKRRPAVPAGKTLSPKKKRYLQRKEFNPFLKNAWLLMGRAQFQKGEFLEAASTFSYIMRLYEAEPAVANEARIWLGRSYAQLDWLYDAEEALKPLGKDSLSPALRREHNATMADLLMRQERYDEAVPYLEAAAKKARRKQQKARLYFLLGQVQQHKGNGGAAYKAYRKCISQSPPYLLEFNARIRQAEVMAGGSGAKKMLKRLKSMARSGKNKDYLDQVYYAIGNIHLTQKDTAAAIGAYEEGRAKSTRNEIEKGVLLLRLAEIYWDKGRYDLAQGCYTEAISIIGENYEGYEEISRRSKVLDQLVPHTSAVYLQDSLLALSVMSEADRNAAIDRVIEQLKKKEEEERRLKADSAAEARRQQGGFQQNKPTQPGQNGGDGQEWYFYNANRVTQGKQDFRKFWGTRKNEDNWRRSNRTVLNEEPADSVDYEDEDSDSLMANSDSLPADTANMAPQDSVQNDPHQREYYLAQIPFSEEAKAGSHRIIQEALFQAGLIEKDDLEDFPLAARTLTRLHTDYPQFENLEEVYYQLFLLYSRWGKKDKADEYRQRLAQAFPRGAYARMITDPDFERNAHFGMQIEDSLYTATYEAYRNRDREKVQQNFDISTQKYPKGANRPKFIFIHALSRIGQANSKDIIAELRALVKDYPESDVSEMAGMIVKGLESGRTVGDPHYQLGSLWERRTQDAEKTAEQLAQGQELSADRNLPFVCLIAYPTDSLDDDQLLYDVAQFNFKGFMVRNFDLAIERGPELTTFRISGFNNYDEAHQYQQKIYSAPQLAEKLRHTRLFLISAKNLELIGSVYSFADYQRFYEKAFAPLKINPQLPLDTPGGAIEQHYEDEYTDEELKKMQQGKDDTEDDDDGEWY